MKGIFVVFHGFASHNGISKKIFYQKKALASLGHDVRLCYPLIDANDGHYKRMLDDFVLEDYGTGITAKIKKRICYGAVTRYVRENGIEFAYVRSDHNANPALIRWFSALKKAGVKIVMEIPTYPYDSEYSRSPLKRRLSLAVDKCFRRALAKRIDRIVTFTDLDEIFGTPTIRISNGIDFSAIPVKKHVNDTSLRVNLIGVAQVHFWHGFDRVIEGMAAYYAGNPEREVVFHIVGEGVAEEICRLKNLSSGYGLDGKVIFHGCMSEQALDDMFETCDIGIASLGRHRNGITGIKTLKNREYAARGIPFTYSEMDDDFDTMPYVMKSPADESPLDIGQLLDFYHALDMTPAQIRDTIYGRLSWDVQMEKVMDGIRRL